MPKSLITTNKFTRPKLFNKLIDADLQAAHTLGLNAEQLAAYEACLNYTKAGINSFNWDMTEEERLGKAMEQAIADAGFPDLEALQRVMH